MAGVDPDAGTRSGALARAPTATVSEATLLAGRYRLVKRVGQGGFSEVWAAEDKHLHERKVAIKILARAPTDDAETERRARFDHEARVLTKLTSRNIVRIWDKGETEDGRLFIVMEFLLGRSLAERLQADRRLSVYDTLFIVREVAEALTEAHAQGLVHRDLKPGNIFLQRLASNTTQVRVLDFGIAKAIEEDAELAASLPKTRPGLIYGTPPYMALEQFEGQATAASDLFALGVVAYECLSGHCPFEGSLRAIVSMHVRGAPPPPLAAELGVPTAVAQLVMQLLERTPDRRPGSARALHERVDALLKTTEPPPTPQGPRASCRVSPSAATSRMPSAVRFIGIGAAFAGAVLIGLIALALRPPVVSVDALARPVAGSVEDPPPSVDAPPASASVVDAPPAAEAVARPATPTPSPLPLLPPPRPTATPETYPRKRTAARRPPSAPPYAATLRGGDVTFNAAMPAALRRAFDRCATRATAPQPSRIRLFLYPDPKVTPQPMTRYSKCLADELLRTERIALKRIPSTGALITLDK